MKIIAIAAAALFALPATAHAISFEAFGNAPRAQQPGWAEGVLGVVNLESRVYSLEHGFGDLNFFYQGDARALNEAIGKFAAVKAEERRLVLLPGRGKTHSFDRKAIDFDWRLYVPAGRNRAVMTAYIDSEKPRGLIGRKKAEKWVGGLDSDSFEVRQAASRELGKLGRAAKPFLREALKARPSLEVHRRIDVLLAKLKGRDTSDLEIPAGVTVVPAGDLLEAHLKDLTGADGRNRIAMGGVVELAPYSAKVVPALAGWLDKGKNEYDRRFAAASLGSVGAGARSALPALKAGLGDPDPNVRTAFRTAIDQIEKARPEPGWEGEIKRRLSIMKDLDELKTSGKK
jgi:hypothetical protein